MVKSKKSWDADTLRYHHRENSSKERQIVTKIAMAINKILHSIRVMGRDKSLFEMAHEVGSLGDVARNQEPEVKRAYYQFRSKLEQFMNSLDESERKLFFQAHGQNPLDWGFVKVSKLVPRGKFASRMFQKRADKFDIIPMADMLSYFHGALTDNRGPEEDHKGSEEGKTASKKSANATCSQCGKPLPGKPNLPKGYEKALVCKNCADKVDSETGKTFNAKLNQKQAGPSEDDAVTKIIEDPGLDALVDAHGGDNADLAQAIFQKYFGKFPAANFNEVVDKVVEQLTTEVEVVASADKVTSPNPIMDSEARYAGKPFEKFHPGDKVQVDEKGGFHANTKGVVVDPKYVTYVPKPKGEYGIKERPFDPEREAVVLDTRGNYFTMFHSRLNKVGSSKRASALTQSEHQELVDTAFLWRESVGDPLHQFAVNGLVFNDEAHRDAVEDAIQECIMTVKRAPDMHSDEQLKNLMALLDFAWEAPVKQSGEVKQSSDEVDLAVEMQKEKDYLKSKPVKKTFIFQQGDEQPVELKSIQKAVLFLCRRFGLDPVKNNEKLWTQLDKIKSGDTLTHPDMGITITAWF